jgi:hypothetical protein
MGAHARPQHIWDGTTTTKTSNDDDKRHLDATRGRHDDDGGLAWQWGSLVKLSGASLADTLAAIRWVGDFS